MSERHTERGALRRTGLARIFAGTVLIALYGAAVAAPAQAQAPRHSFNCIGAEELDDDVFAVPFRPGSAQVTDAARSALAAAAQLLKSEPDRNACVLGHTDREGGQATNVRLAASRARAVAEALAGTEKIATDRLRSEARVAGFSRRTGNRQQRSVTIVVLPAKAPAPVPAQPPAAVPTKPAAPPAPTSPPVTPGSRVPSNVAPGTTTPGTAAPDAAQPPGSRGSAPDGSAPRQASPPAPPATPETPRTAPATEPAPSPATGGARGPETGGPASSAEAPGPGNVVTIPAAPSRKQAD